MTTLGDSSTSSSWTVIPDVPPRKPSRRSSIIRIYFSMMATFLISIVGTAFVALLLASNEPTATQLQPQIMWTDSDVCPANHSFNITPDMLTVAFYPEQDTAEFTWYSLLGNPLVQTAMAGLLQLFCLVKVTCQLFKHLQPVEQAQKQKSQDRKIKVKAVREKFLQKMLLDRTKELKKLKKSKRQQVKSDEDLLKFKEDIYKVAFEEKAGKVKQQEENKWGQKHEGCRRPEQKAGKAKKARKRNFASKRPL